MAPGAQCIKSLIALSKICLKTQSLSLAAVPQSSLVSFLMVISRDLRPAVSTSPYSVTISLVFGEDSSDCWGENHLEVRGDSMINTGRGSVGYRPGPFPKDLDRLGAWWTSSIWSILRTVSRNGWLLRLTSKRLWSELWIAPLPGAEQASLISNEPQIHWYSVKMHLLLHPIPEPLLPAAGGGAQESAYVDGEILEKISDIQKGKNSLFLNIFAQWSLFQTEALWGWARSVLYSFKDSSILRLLMHLPI